MTHSTFRNDNEAPWKNLTNDNAADPMHGEHSSSKHSSAGKESQLRKEMTKTEEAARQAHRRTDVKDHPSFNNAKPTTRG
jgi:hypothetical protein